MFNIFYFKRLFISHLYSNLRHLLTKTQSKCKHLAAKGDSITWQGCRSLARRQHRSILYIWVMQASCSRLTLRVVVCEVEVIFLSLLGCHGAGMTSCGLRRASQSLVHCWFSMYYLSLVFQSCPRVYWANMQWQKRFKRLLDRCYLSKTRRSQQNTIACLFLWLKNRYIIFASTVTGYWTPQLKHSFKFWMI